MLDNKRIMITGASSGIGRAIAIKLSEKRCHLVVSGRDPTRLKEVAQACEAGPALSVTPMNFDLTQYADIPGWLRSQEALPNILVHCAGTTPRGFIEDIPLEASANCLILNTLAFIALCQVLIPEMKARKSGQILVITSGHAKSGMRGFATYSAAKSGLERVCEALSAEVASWGISINLLSPGAVDTPPMRVTESYSPDLPMRRIKKKRSTEEIAEAALEVLQKKKSITLGLSGKLVRHLAYWAPGILRNLFERK